MTTRPRRSDVERIAKVRAPWCVTIYGDVDSWLRGNHPNWKAGAQVRSAIDGLHVGGASRGVVEAIRGHLERLSTRSPAAPVQIDRRARSVGTFATENRAEVFVLTTSPAPWTGVADRFLVAPLLEGVLALIPPVFVLAISENRLRLVDVTAFPIAMVEVPDLPRDLRSTVDLDLTGDRNALAHLRTSEDPKGRLGEYARAIDRAVEPVLRRAGAELVIAAAQPLASIYRSTTAYDRVVSSALLGNHDEASIEELADLAEPIIEGHRRAAREGSLARFAEMPDRDLVLTDLDEIAAAARDGALDTLFVDTDRRVPVQGEAFEGRTVIDRVDEVVRDALARQTVIVPVRSDALPAPGPMAAILRYEQAGQPAGRAR